MTDTISGARRRSIRIAALAFTALAPALLAAEAAQAQTAVADRSYNLDIPAQTLARSMATLSTQTGLQVVYADDAPLSTNAPAVKGRMTVEQALARLTAGTGFTYRFTGPGVVTLVKASAGGNGDGEVVTGVVSVEGVQGSGSPYFGGAGQAAGVNGINGSRDITATEGTGSFTSGALTIGSKVPQALKDVPQSISVLTSERLAQQNVTDFTTAMKQLPGITLVQGASSLENTFYSRGFAITSIQVDGGAPLTTTNGFYPQIDMSIYDHVELLRGAAGLFNGYGDPSGTVNLARKKPLDHSQFSVEAQTGSWSNYRVVADATSPMALDGKLRGRLVMTYQDNHYFYDTAKDNKTLIYGIAELDATPTTLLTAGVSYTRQNSLPWYNGLPRYQTGGSLDVSRSTSLVFPWNRWNFDTTEIFGGVDQKLGEQWNLKLNLTYNRQRSLQKLGYSNGPVNPMNDLGPTMSGIYNNYASQQLSTEVTLTGAFEIFGQRQEITLGANRQDSDSGGQNLYGSLVASSYLAPYQPYPGGPQYCYTTSPNPLRQCPPGTVAPATPPINVFDFNPYDPIYTEPRNPVPFSHYNTSGSVQWDAYMNLRLTAFDRLHLITGIRWSRYEHKLASEDYCTTTTDDCIGLQVGDVYNRSASKYKDDDVSWPPSVNLSFDVTKQLTAYVGYSDIYLSQQTYLGSDLKPIDPVTGSNIEAGLKWAASNGRLNLALSAYRVEQNGFPTTDGSYDNDTGDFVAGNGQHFPNYGQIDSDHYCCYKADPNRTLRSRGMDFEVSGEITRGWQVSAGYTYNETKREGSYFGVNEGIPNVSIQPKHLYKLWMSYDFEAGGQAGALSGLIISLGMNGQSSAYYAGGVCANLGNPNPITGASDCVSYDPPDYVDYAFTVPAYAVFSGRIDYRVSDIWSLAVNLENIFDKTYYQAAASVYGGNWYGTPRSYTATLRAKW